MCIRDRHLPCDVIDVVVDDYDHEIITYLVMTKNTKGDWTKNTNVDKFYEIIMWNDPVSSYGIMDKTNLMSYYINSNNMVNVNQTEMCYGNVRLNFDNGG